MQKLVFPMENQMIFNMAPNLIGGSLEDVCGAWGCSRFQSWKSDGRIIRSNARPQSGFVFQYHRLDCCSQSKRWYWKNKPTLWTGVRPNDSSIQLPTLKALPTCGKSSPKRRLECGAMLKPCNTRPLVEKVQT